MTKIDKKSVEHATQTANADEFIIKLGRVQNQHEFDQNYANKIKMKDAHS